MAANQSKLSWQNPTTRVNGQPYPQNENARYEVNFDQSPVWHPLPLKFGTSFDLTSVPQYKALLGGAHTVQLRTVDSNGLASLPTAPVSFTIATAPNPPSGLTIS